VFLGIACQQWSIREKPWKLARSGHGPNQVTMFERTAGYVVRILSKAKNRPACPSTSQRHLS
jgi:hypothetical protein